MQGPPKSKALAEEYLPKAWPSDNLLLAKRVPDHNGISCSWVSFIHFDLRSSLLLVIRICLFDIPILIRVEISTIIHLEKVDLARSHS